MGELTGSDFTILMRGHEQIQDDYETSDNPAHIGWLDESYEADEYPVLVRLAADGYCELRAHTPEDFQWRLTDAGEKKLHSHLEATAIIRQLGERGIEEALETLRHIEEFYRGD